MLSRYSNTVMRVNMLKTLNAIPTRDFAAKKQKKPKANDEQLTEYETVDENAQSPSWTQAADTPAWLKQNGVLNLDKSLFVPFTVGDIKVVKKTPDNKAPSYEDTIEGRYANVLFTTASAKEALFEVYEDMIYLSELYTHSEVFRQFTENAGVGHKEIKLLNKALLETASFNDITIHFLTVLAENKRLIYIKDIAGKYQKLYQQFNKEEKITIISSETLTETQKDQVLKAL